MMIRRASQEDLYRQLRDKLLPQIRSALADAGVGQRLRVTTLPEPVIEQLCAQLQGAEGYRACVLSAELKQASWFASSTKLIELRNTLAEPLLVFIPPDLR